MIYEGVSARNPRTKNGLKFYFLPSDEDMSDNSRSYDFGEETTKMVILQPTRPLQPNVLMFSSRGCHSNYEDIRRHQTC